MLVFIGIMQIFALIFVVIKEQIDLNIFAIIPLAWAVGYLLLSFPVRHRSKNSAYAAIAMLVLDTCLFVAPIPPNKTLPVMIGGVAIRLIALKALIQGIGAISKIKTREATRVAGVNVIE